MPFKIQSLTPYILMYVFCCQPLAGVFAQEKCPSKQYLLSLREKFPDYTRTPATHASLRTAAAVDTTLYTIPVVVHIIHNNSQGTIGGSGNSNITDQQVYSQMDVLNEDYRKKINTSGYNNDPVGADTRIEFRLANKDPHGNATDGIVRVYSSQAQWDPVSDASIYKALSYWPSDQYLNIWVLDMTSTNLGFAQFPSGSGYSDLDGPDPGAATDGIAVDHAAFGRIGTAKGKYRFGRTATHEIGHWFGLEHIWGDADCGDDYIGDTPVQRSSSLNLSESCPPTKSNCTGVFTLDMSNNYLDYSPDICMNIFTQGQAQRMRNVLRASPRRIAILSSKGYEPVLAGVSQTSATDEGGVFRAGFTPEGTLLIAGAGSGIGNASLLLSNIMGEMVMEQSNFLMEGNILSLPADKLGKGIYMLRFSIGNLFFTRKVMKE